MKSKKASLVMSPMIMLWSFLLIVMLFVIFFGFFNYETANRKIIIEKAEGNVGDNLFMLGLLRSDLKGVQFSQVLSQYQINNDSAIQTKIREHINNILESLYEEKPCWMLTVSSKKITDIDNCIYFGDDDKILSLTTLPGYSLSTFEVKFETIEK